MSVPADPPPFSEQQYEDPPPLSIPPPQTVVIAAVLVVLEAVGLLVLAGSTLIAGLIDDVVGRTLAQAGYYVVLAGLLGLCANALFRGRRWGRTPSLIVQVVLVLIGVWLIAPSQQYFWGIVLILAGGITGYLLLSRPANAWISRFPLPFAEPDQ